jgi:hypothetical protein
MNAPVSWTDVAARRVARVFRLVVLLVAFGCAFATAFASDCSASWEVVNVTDSAPSGQFPWGTTTAAVCTGAQDWANLWGVPATVSSCTGSAGSVTWHASGAGEWDFSATNTAGSDCGPTDPAPAYVSHVPNPLPSSHFVLMLIVILGLIAWLIFS